MKSVLKIISVIIILAAVSALFTPFAFADGPDGPAPVTEEEKTPDSSGIRAAAAAAVVAVVAAAGAVGMAVSISKCASAMSRQPEIAEKINSSMMLGLVFIETAIIYALIVAILIIFVL